MVRKRPGLRQVNWWLPTGLLDKLKDYQHQNRLESLTDAAKKVLDESLRDHPENGRP